MTPDAGKPRKHFSMVRGMHLADLFTLANAAGLRGGWDWVVLIYFVCCGVSRLARYNVTAEELSEGADKVAYFEGTPIPTSVVLTGVLAVAAWRDRLGGDLYWGVWSLGPGNLHRRSRK